ncbi:MAG: hypothetical protein ACP5PA_06850, partial [Elusimicrobiales bacterium]
MKGIIVFFLIAQFLGAAGYRTYKMDMDFFRCLIPSDWKIERDADKDKQSSIYKLVLIHPSNPKVSITLKYYTANSGKNYKDFIEKNSKTEDGKLEGPNERYENVKEIKISQRKAFEINRRLKEFESVELKSDYYWLKERIIVVPAKKGF